MLRCKLLKLMMSNAWFQMQPYNLLISLIGSRTNTLFMYILQPMSEKMSDFLLGTCDKHPLLLLIQCCFELFLNLPSRFSVEEFALSSLKCDFCCPATVFTPVNRAFAISAFCHKGTPFICAQL